MIYLSKGGPVPIRTIRGSAPATSTSPIFCCPYFHLSLVYCNIEKCHFQCRHTLILTSQVKLELLNYFLSSPSLIWIISFCLPLSSSFLSFLPHSPLSSLPPHSLTIPFPHIFLPPCQSSPTIFPWFSLLFLSPSPCPWCPFFNPYPHFPCHNIYTFHVYTTTSLQSHCQYHM